MRSNHVQIKEFLLGLVVFGTICFIAAGNSLSSVVKEGGKVYIVDRKGDRFDVTQAESIGFKPEKFQYGMGKDYFTPLDDSHVSNATENVRSNLRVLGVADDHEAKAYSISRLSRHEIANSTIGSEPIAVGY